MICAWVRYRLQQSLDTGRPAGWMVRAHLERCAECRQFERRLVDLDRRLREDSAADAVPAALHERILAAVAAASRQPSTSARKPAPACPRRRLWTAAGLAAAAAIVAAAGLLIHLANRPGGPPPPNDRIAKPPRNVLPAGENEMILPGVVEAPSALVSSLTQPLHEEVRDLAEQGKKAATFVLNQALMFLDADGLEAFASDNGKTKG